MKIRVIGGMLMLGYCVQVTATGVVWAKPSPVPAPHKVEPHKVESHKVQLHQAESDKDELHQVTAAQNGRLTRISPAKNTVEPPKQDVVGTTQTPPRHIAPVHHLGMTPAVPAGDLVAPLSNGLSLKWSLSEVRQKFGQPKLGGACELNYGRFVVSQCGNSPSVTINTADVRLHSGVGVGTDRTDVMRIFGANPYDPTIGLYHLVFSYIGNSVSAISIVYTGNVASSPVAATTQPAVSPVTISSRAIVMPNSSEIENSPQGVYWCYEPSWSSGSIRLLPDGDYQVNDVTVGRYTVQHNRIIFTGYLKDRNNGIAQIYNNSFVFKWTDKQGEAQYFAYRKNR